MAPWLKIRLHDLLDSDKSHAANKRFAAFSI